MSTTTTFVSVMKYPVATLFMALLLTACGSGNPMDATSTLTVADVIAGENAGAMNFTVARVGSLTATATVDYATLNGTAVAGSDYTATSGTLTFAPGESAHTIAVPLIDDDIPELTEELSLN
jgi:Calx-beta domain